MSQGQSRFTPNKIAGFEAAFVQNLAIVRGGIGQSSYFHFDLNAGCGWNHHANCEGSPLAFRAAANRADFPSALCFCCEVDRVAADELAKRTKADGATFSVCGRNQDFVRMIPHIIRRHGGDPATAYGSILIDPNNQRRSAIPYEELRDVARVCPRLDVFFNFPQNAMKRITSAVAKGTHPESAAKDCYDIDDMREVIGKKFLWIKQLPEMGDFALIVGRNMSGASHDKKTGLKPWDSLDGVHYRERCKMPVDVAESRHRERLAIQSGQKMLFT